MSDYNANEGKQAWLYCPMPHEMVIGLHLWLFELFCLWQSIVRLPMGARYQGNSRILIAW